MIIFLLMHKVQNILLSLYFKHDQIRIHLYILFIWGHTSRSMFTLGESPWSRSRRIRDVVLVVYIDFNPWDLMYFWRKYMSIFRLLVCIHSVYKVSDNHPAFWFFNAEIFIQFVSHHSVSLWNLPLNVLPRSATLSWLALWAFHAVLQSLVLFPTLGHCQHWQVFRICLCSAFQ